MARVAAVTARWASTDHRCAGSGDLPGSESAPAPCSRCRRPARPARGTVRGTPAAPRDARERRCEEPGGPASVSDLVCRLLILGLLDEEGEDHGDDRDAGGDEEG